MALFKFSFIGLIVVCICYVIPGCLPSNFPLQNCSTKEMNILLMYDLELPIIMILTMGNNFPYSHSDSEQAFNRFDVGLREFVMDFQFVDHIFSFTDEKTTPIIRISPSCSSLVYNRIIINDNVLRTHITFISRADSITMSCDDIIVKTGLSVQKILESKISFIQRLFYEMSGVRKNVTHIAVIFLDGEDLSYEESRNIPHIVQQHQTDIKIFTVVFGVKHIKEGIHLNDTLLLNNGYRSTHILTMAICNQCIEGWFPFVHSYSTDYLSCYKLFKSPSKRHWFDAMDTCTKGGTSLATMETQEELNRVRELLYQSIREGNITGDVDPDNSSQFSAQIYIGLQRDLSSTANRFKWSLRNPVRYRPMVVNKWMTGEPSGGREIACGMWKFFTKDHKNDIDGWDDVECSNQLSNLFLCEAVLPRRLDGQNTMRINPASNKSFTIALKKGHFRNVNNNIVLVTTQGQSKRGITGVNVSEKELFPLFDCGENEDNPRFISYDLVCDYKSNCSNNRDESVCVLAPHDVSCVKVAKDDKMNTIVSTIVRCCDGEYLPAQWINDGEVDCLVCNYGNRNLNDEDELFALFGLSNRNCSFFCNLGECVYFSQLNDSHIDCTGSEGPLDETYGKLETVNTCNSTLDHIRWAPRCVYFTDMYYAIMGCRDVSHLQNCTDFECPEGYFKCPQSYCIPIHYVLDGIVDCPTGEDEQNDNIVSCTRNFACSNSKVCVHPDLVCDGHAECPYQDDELDCKVTCREGFLCVTFGVMVTNYNKSSPLTNIDFIDSRTKYLDLSQVDLSQIKYINASRLENVVGVKWSQCRIDNLSELLPFLSRKVQTMDISYNLIKIFNYSVSQYPALENIRYLNLSYNKELVDVTFLKPNFLNLLDLSHTGLQCLNESFLEGLPQIKHLNLSYTFISGFHKIFLPSRFNLRTLDLRGLDMKNFYNDYFNGLSVSQHLYTDSFEICCPQIRGVNIQYHTCQAPENAISSCFNLVGVNLQRVLLWLVAVLAVLGNVTVILYRVILDRSVLRTGYGLFVTNLGISDFIMGVYLFIIAGADYYYRDVYVLYDKNWREGNVCRLAGFLATLSCETSTYFVFLITLDRFLVMKFPFGQIQFSTKSKTISLILSWIIGFLLALIPIVFKFEINSSNAMCLGLPLTTQRLTGWQYSFGVFIVHNFVMFIIIAYGQRAIFKAMSSNRISGSTSSRWVQDILVAKQLFLIALSNFFCWFPIGIMGLMSLGEHEINIDVYAWTTVIILPLNSAANPVLYTIPALMFKWEKFKHNAVATNVIS